MLGLDSGGRLLSSQHFLRDENNKEWELFLKMKFGVLKKVLYAQISFVNLISCSCFQWLLPVVFTCPIYRSLVMYRLHLIVLLFVYFIIPVIWRFMSAILGLRRLQF
jgi:hypothetical protein